MRLSREERDFGDMMLVVVFSGFISFFLDTLLDIFGPASLV